MVYLIFCLLNSSLTWKEATNPTLSNSLVSWGYFRQEVLETLSLCNLSLKFTTKQILEKGQDYELVTLVGFTPNNT